VVERLEHGIPKPVRGCAIDELDESGILLGAGASLYSRAGNEIHCASPFWWSIRSWKTSPDGRIAVKKAFKVFFSCGLKSAI
jgi:hypothetical protein